MNWHETIAQIRKDPQYADLVRLAYFDADLKLNVERFGQSAEFAETLKLIKEAAPSAQSILDIGAGNGISSVNLAFEGYEVTAVEPDPSDSVGANAIRQLQTAYALPNLSVFEQYAERIGFVDASFDIIYVRQAMHHAYELKQFLVECARVLKPGGILLTVRDHVVFDTSDKERFLQEHPLHKFYGGENAFTAEEYKAAMRGAGLVVEKELKYYDSVINYFPMSTHEKGQLEQDGEQKLKQALRKKIGSLANIPMLFALYQRKNNIPVNFLNEREVSGRMYSYLCRKP